MNVDELSDEEHQRHDEEELDQPDLDELRDARTDSVKSQHTLPDEPQDAHDGTLSGPGSVAPTISD
ncbi:hypothetical protein [Mycobacterium sp. 852002-51163_SCH5372311]|uniref:hypothetical protein n=1 Tax=Mycobacterium sp. 852002-51163_SCH5372311 TaxID=1834097 RepID=UPI001E37AF51|nr:hypothetical protein [Mycobacterium sp. 852002-51163_SCH5372311]